MKTNNVIRDIKIKHEFRNRSIEWWNPRDEGYDTKKYLIFLYASLRSEHIQNVLEVAVGRGRFAFLLAMGKKNVCAIDINKDFITFCKEKNDNLKLPNIKFLMVDSEFLSFRDKSFDATICIDALMHFPNIDAAISEMIRVTKPGGLIIVSFMSKTSLRYLAFLYQKSRGFYGQNPSIWYYTISSIRKIIKDNCAHLEEIAGVHAIPAPRLAMKYRFLLKSNSFLEKLAPFACSSVLLKIRKRQVEQ